MMRTSWTILSSCMLFATSVRGWGALFNRYNPSLLSSYDTSGSYYNLMTKTGQEVAEPKVIVSPIEQVLQAEAEEDDPCHKRKCTSNEHCCGEDVCVDTMEGVTGTCLPVFGKREGEGCYRDSDCETGYICTKNYGGYKQCLLATPGAGKFGDECDTSSDCNIHVGLCCRTQRRGRGKMSRLCAYFTSEETCVGDVQKSQVRNWPKYHTAGEKRQSPHPDHSYLRYR